MFPIGISKRVHNHRVPQKYISDFSSLHHAEQRSVQAAHHMTVSIEGARKRLQIRPYGLVQPAHIQIFLQTVFPIQVVLLALPVQQILLQFLLCVNGHHLPAFGTGCPDAVQPVAGRSYHQHADYSQQQIVLLSLRLCM